MLAILRKEFVSFLSSLIAYLVMAVFLTSIGLFMWVFPETNIFNAGYADMETLFSLSPYVFMFLVPAITMRSIAEEAKTGTLELLLTRPLRDWDIILGKYLACWLLVCVALAPTLLYYYSVVQLGNPVGNIDTAATIGSYVGLLLLGAVFTAIGLFASSLTESQIVAFVLAVFFCFFLFDGLGSLANINDTSAFSYYVSQWGMNYHYQSLRRGLIDSRDILYFLSILVLMLWATQWRLSSRRA
ncbi:gliding motility-associated ABC transporter permease subunit GldF [Eisenibacter elegans]|jgi:ABC-2 type transport system permease protein|uniref:gliding motility-associated ABC transporter permease subunit GldF n=1 Tax=Eisenibacter elegans TaxID=997 RepID=UPI000429DFCD|nr:gliding motility-associated ABC transporter permease subunit GldF [Eisenibacter elegans]